MTKLIVGAAAITKAIASIANRGTKLDADIQACGLSVIAHASEHGDSTLADKLLNAMPKGGRKLALTEWMLAHSQLRLLDKKADAEAIGQGRVFALDRTKTLDMAGAEATKWHEFKKEAPVHTAFDAQKAVHSLLSRFQGALAKGTSIEGRAKALEDARALVTLLEGGQSVSDLPEAPL